MTTATLLVFRRKAQMELEQRFPATVRIPGRAAGDVTCAGGTIKEVGASLRSGGQVVACDLVFRVRRELLTGKPDIGQRLVFTGVSWRIVQLTDPTADVAYVIYCDNSAK